jgi:hypothetical protein
VISGGDEQAIQDLCDQGALSILTKALRKYVNDSNAVLEQIDIDIESDILFNISCLCENDLHRKVKIFFLCLSFVCLIVRNFFKITFLIIQKGTVRQRRSRNTNRCHEKEAPSCMQRLGLPSANSRRSRLHMGDRYWLFA